MFEELAAKAFMMFVFLWVIITFFLMALCVFYKRGR